jgi:hypothetical protein
LHCQEASSACPTTYGPPCSARSLLYRSPPQPAGEPPASHLLRVHLVHLVRYQRAVTRQLQLQLQVALVRVRGRGRETGTRTPSTTITSSSNCGERLRSGTAMSLSLLSACEMFLLQCRVLQ